MVIVIWDQRSNFNQSYAWWKYAEMLFILEWLTIGPVYLIEFENTKLWIGS